MLKDFQILFFPAGKKSEKQTYHSFYATDFNPGVSIEYSDSNTDFKLRL